MTAKDEATEQRREDAYLHFIGRRSLRGEDCGAAEPLQFGRAAFDAGWEWGKAETAAAVAEARGPLVAALEEIRGLCVQKAPPGATVHLVDNRAEAIDRIAAAALADAKGKTP